MDVSFLPADLSRSISIEKSDKTRIRIQRVEWQGAYDPVGHWFTARALHKEASQAEVEAAVWTIIHQGRYIKQCEVCQEYGVNGMLLAGELCFSCAQQQGYLF